MSRGATAYLPIEQRGDPDLILVHRLGYLLEGQAFYRVSIHRRADNEFHGFFNRGKNVLSRDSRRTEPRFSIEKFGVYLAWIGFSERIVSHGRTRLQCCRVKEMGPYIYSHFHPTHIDRVRDLSHVIQQMSDRRI